MASRCRRDRGCGHEPDDGDYRARDAQVFPVPDADDGVDDHAAGAADRAGECVWGKDPRRVDEDHGTQAIRIKEAFDAVRANMRTFVTIPYDNEVQAREDVRNGKIQGAVIIPPQYSKLVYEKNHPRVALIVDNSDNFMSSTLEDEMNAVTDALNQPDVSPRLLQ